MTINHDTPEAIYAMRRGRLRCKARTVFRILARSSRDAAADLAMAEAGSSCSASSLGLLSLVAARRSLLI